MGDQRGARMSRKELQFAAENEKLIINGRRGEGVTTRSQLRR